MLELDKLVLFGDSIFQRSSDPELSFVFHGALQNAYQRKLDVINRGFSGYNSEHARNIISKLIACENNGTSFVRLMVVFFGSNDSASNWQNVPLERYKDNLKTIVEEALQNDIKVVLVGVATHESDNYELGETEQENPRNCDRNLEYNKAASQVAKDFNIPFVDLYRAFSESKAESTDLLPDGLHYGGQGYKLFYSELMEAIQMGYPELIPDNLPTLLPHYSELANTHDDLEKALFGGVDGFIMHR